MFRHELEVDRNIENVNIEGSKVFGEFKVPPDDPEAKPQAGRQSPKLEEVRDHVAGDGPVRPFVGSRVARPTRRDYKVTELPDNTFLVLLCTC